MLVTPYPLNVQNAGITPSGLQTQSAWRMCKEALQLVMASSQTGQRFNPVQAVSGACWVCWRDRLPVTPAGINSALAVTMIIGNDLYYSHWGQFQRQGLSYGCLQGHPNKHMLYNIKHAVCKVHMPLTVYIFILNKSRVVCLQPSQS